ncbi:MAG: hypothetical protein PHR71_05030 [Polaromonas sp.]|nr:hypothetical protein [Polaromonas sp.]
MIAKNYRQFPQALMQQHELELVFPVNAEVNEHELSLIRATFAAGGQWLTRYMTKIKSTAKAPAWYLAMKRRAKALARAIKAALLSFF